MSTTPNSPTNDDSQGRQALVRTLTNQLNQNERHHRHTMISQQDLADNAKQYAERSDQGHHSICSMLDEVSDQIAEGHEQMATKADVRALLQKMNRIEEHLIQNDHVVIPRDQSNLDLEDDFFD